MYEVEVEEDDSKEGDFREVINPSTHNAEDEVEEASEENPEEENLMKVPPKEFPERILRPKMLIKMDAGTAGKSVIG